MKVGFVTPYLTRSGGGIFTSAQRLAQTLAPETSVRVFGLEDPIAPEDLETWAPVPIAAFPVRGPRSVGYAPGLSRALRSADVDLIHAHGLWTHPSIDADRSGKPCVISPHGMLEPWALSRMRWKKKLAGALFQNAHLRRAACLHALCQPEVESIRAYGLTNPICVLPNGIDLPPPGGEPAPWAAQIPPHEKVLLYLGRLHQKKGLPELIHAWPAADPAWHLVIAGWDQEGHEAELRKLTAEVRADRVHFPGPQFGAAKLATYRRADGFVLPSLSEGLPMVVLEAWAHGKPVLMTAECNLPEGFASGAALRITPDAESIAHGLRALAALTKTDREAMGGRGRHLVEEQFSWTRIAPRFREVYDWLLGRGPQPSCIIPAAK